MERRKGKENFFLPDLAFLRRGVGGKEKKSSHDRICEKREGFERGKKIRRYQHIP